MSRNDDRYQFVDWQPTKVQRTIRACVDALVIGGAVGVAIVLLIVIGGR